MKFIVSILVSLSLTPVAFAGADALPAAVKKNAFVQAVARQAREGLGGRVTCLPLRTQWNKADGTVVINGSCNAVDGGFESSTLFEIKALFAEDAGALIIGSVKFDYAG